MFSLVLYIWLLLELRHFIFAQILHKILNSI